MVGKVFLDVGASSGTSAMSFRVFNRRNRILSIEPNATLEKELRFLKRIVRGFDYRIAAAGDQRGTITMYVPFYRGVALTAYTASSREDVMGERGGLHAGALSPDPPDRAQRRLRSDPEAPGGPRLLGVRLSGRRRAVRSLHRPQRRSQRVLHASRGDSPDA
jgi:hypothetical protein